MYKQILIAVILLTPYYSFSEGIDMEVDSNTFSLGLSKDRLIIDPSSLGAELGVVNNHEYPILVQSKVYEEDAQTRANDFYITPPLFKLDGQQQSKLRVLSLRKEPESISNEFLHWVCVKGIPPKESDIWNDNKKTNINKVGLGVNIAIDNCIKLIIRPNTLSNLDYNSHPDIEWSKRDGVLKAKNKSPYILSLKSVTINNKTITKPGYILPFSSKEFRLDNEMKNGGKVLWQFITDLGGDSDVIESNINKG